MNFILISPQFPKTYWKFAEGLKKNGVNVLGIGDTPFWQISNELKSNLTEYYYCPNMNDDKELFKAVAFLSFRHGKIDWIESNNEYWLPKDAQLRLDFHVTTGLFPDDLLAYQHKSKMKAYYEKAGVKTARYHLVETLESCLNFIQEVGYPVFVKPDRGMGASNTFKIKNEDDLNAFFLKKEPRTYLMEEFINGTVISFDGMANANSDVVFAASHYFPMPNDEIVNQLTDDFYYTLPQVPEDLMALGKATIKAFEVKNRFFHLEFFRLNENHPYLGAKNQIVALEVNMRPAGGYTLEMIAASQGLNPYHLWADILIKGTTTQVPQANPIYCAEAARRDHLQYVHTHEEIVQKYGPALVMMDRYPIPINAGMGDQFYMVKCQTIEEVYDFRRFVLEHKG